MSIYGAYFPKHSIIYMVSKTRSGPGIAPGYGTLRHDESHSVAMTGRKTFYDFINFQSIKNGSLAILKEGVCP